jgi:hypothetical protein
VKKIIACLLFLSVFAGFLPEAPTQPGKVPPPPMFPRGARPTPFPKIIAAIKSEKAKIFRASAPPPKVIVVPPRLSYWGNNQYGDCVTAESVFAIAGYSTYIGIDEIFVTDSATTSWANSHGFLNGAELLEVIQAMGSDGIKDEKGTLRKAGTPSSVDFSVDATLQSAIAQGPVSIAIDSSGLPSGAGNKSGFYAFGGNSHRNYDHCVSLCGYGPTADLFKALNVSPPSNAPAAGYLLYTWSTIGVVDHAWLMANTTEAWVRNPTTTGLTPAPSPPGAITVSIADSNGAMQVPMKFSPTASGGVSPYIFLFSYGDGIQDAAGTHTYAAAGSYTVNVSAVDSKGQVGQGTCTATVGTTPLPPTPGPTPAGAGTISWTVNGQTSQYELFPVGSRDALKKLQDLIGSSSK